MKKMLLVLAALALCMGTVFAEDPVENYWISWDEKTDKATGGWHIYVKDNMLFGEMVSVAGQPQDTKAYGAKGKKPYKDFPVAGKPEDMPLLGTPWIFRLKMVKPGQWANGFIVDPGDGNLYKCKVTYHAAKGSAPAWLEVRGEIGMGIGRSQHWRAATKEEAEAIR